VLFACKQRFPYIDVEQFVEMLFRDGPEGNEFANTGVGENNIDSPLYLRDGLVKAIKVSQLGDVSLNSRNVVADCFYGFVEFLLATAREKDEGTLFDEKFCRSQTNSFGAACDESGLAFELFGHCLSPPFELELSRSGASTLDRAAETHRVYLRGWLETSWPRDSCEAGFIEFPNLISFSR
jgi:hypothetical protein